MGSPIWVGHVEAHSLFEESVEIYGDLGARAQSHLPSILLGIAKNDLGQYEQARDLGQRCLVLAQEIGNQRGMANSYYLQGLVALAIKAYTEAQALLRESVSIYQQIGQREQLGNALVNLAVAECRLGRLPEMKRCLCQALKMLTETRPFITLTMALPTVALLLAEQNELERAVELYALASRLPAVAGRWFDDVFGRHIAAAAATLPPDVVAAAQERGRQRELWATVEELLTELEG
jgi:tetratricopeptide (TPR) repeat protein